MKSLDESTILIRRLLLDIKNLRTRQGYLNAGYPNYNTLFGRDSLIAALQCLPIYPEIAASTLRILAKYQAKRYEPTKEAEPGKILHEYRLDPEKQAQLPNWSWPYYGSVDSTSLFLILLSEYFNTAKDTKILYELWPAATLAAKWHLDNAAKNTYGFISYDPFRFITDEHPNHHGLFHQGWKDSPENHLKIVPPVAIAEEQGYAYLAMKSYLAFLKQPDLTIVDTYHEETKNFLKAIKTNFIRQFWMEDEQYFALALDGKSNQRKAVTSNPGHLLMCGDFLEKKYAKVVVRRLFRKDMWTVGGIRTHSEKEPDFDPFSYHLGSIWPHDNWMIYHGLKRRGFHKEANRIKMALLKAYYVLDGIPECYAVVRHGFLKRQKILPLKKIEQLERNAELMGKKHLPTFTANLLQAWATGALLNMLLVKNGSTR